MFAGTKGDRSIYDQQHQIDTPQPFIHCVKHPAIHAISRLVDPGCIHENDLPSGFSSDSENPVACGLRFIRHDRNLLTDQCVKKSGFSGIGPSDDYCSAGFHIRHDEIFSLHDAEFTSVSFPERRHPGGSFAASRNRKRAGEMPNAAKVLFLRPGGPKENSPGLTPGYYLSPLRGFKNYAALGETPAFPAFTAI